MLIICPARGRTVSAIAVFAALHHADVAGDIGWINLHGTGTRHNDSMESTAVAEVFGSDTPCTSTKPFTGHTGAAGAVEAALLWGMVSRRDNPEGRLPLQAGRRARRIPVIDTAGRCLMYSRCRTVAIG